MDSRDAKYTVNLRPDLFVGQILEMGQVVHMLMCASRFGAGTCWVTIDVACNDPPHKATIAAVAGDYCVSGSGRGVAPLAKDDSVADYWIANRPVAF